jgi:hypothetical protein
MVLGRGAKVEILFELIFIFEFRSSHSVTISKRYKFKVLLTFSFR